MSILGLALSGLIKCLALVEILDAVVVDPVEDGVEADGNRVEVFQSDPAFIKLTVG
jgi:hypothetical protein